MENKWTTEPPAEPAATIARLERRVAVLREERDAAVRAVLLVKEWFDREDSHPPYPEGTKRDTPGNELIWRIWFDGNMDACRAATEAVNEVAALAKAGGA